MRTQRLIDVMDHGDVLDVVQRIALELAASCRRFSIFSMPASVR
jgi:hypothetical protein